MPDFAVEFDGLFMSFNASAEGFLAPALEALIARLLTGEFQPPFACGADAHEPPRANDVAGLAADNLLTRTVSRLAASAGSSRSGPVLAGRCYARLPVVCLIFSTADA